MICEVHLLLPFVRGEMWSTCAPRKPERVSKTGEQDESLLLDLQVIARLLVHQGHSNVLQAHDLEAMQGPNAFVSLRDASTEGTQATPGPRIRSLAPRVAPSLTS